MKCKARGCPFFMCVIGHLKVDGLTVKDFRGEHKHSVGDACEMEKGGKRRLKAKLLTRLVEGKI